jgi:hypothetical protein
MDVTSRRGYALAGRSVERVRAGAGWVTVSVMEGVVRRLVVLVALAAPALAPALPASAATTAQVVGIIETSAWAEPSTDPSGITYSSAKGQLVVVDGEVEETALWDGANAWYVTLTGTATKSWSTTDHSNEPVGVAAPRASTMWIADDDVGRILRWRTGKDGRWGTRDDRVKIVSARAFGANDPEGIALGGGSLFITDGGGAEVYRLDPGPNGRIDGVPPAGDDLVSHFDTSALGVRDPEGVTYDPTSGTLLLVSRRDLVLVRVTLDGALIESIDISASGILRPSDLALAPGSDDATETHIYVTDRGVDNGKDPDQNDGRIFEFELLGPD